ncbi:O-antigen polymerase [Clostridium aceticum]|uniref:O-antigen polymerase n=1 Tax=Clostridium aceticum TaxID=84022 RepID=A0A0D8IAX5_9CLOT|nr:O-antigen ligase family protein [Clostridium aceticum]AKL93652.1 O-antigen polymerase [Clostridium aceticum]KJF27229.1 hypothetical protein TZ02_09200 [Clostridium aceticum]
MKTKELKKKNNVIEKERSVAGKSKGIVVFTLLCILLFYPPFFRGLFFQKEILMTHILSFGLFIIYLINKTTKGEKVTLDSPFDYIGMFFIVAYILPIVFRQWADLREAIGLVLRYVNFFVVYLMVKDYAKEERYKNYMLDVFILSGTLTALIGLLGAAGYVNLPDVVLGGNRISSTFQYPNTLAAFLMTLFFITAEKQVSVEKLWRKNLYATAGFLMIFTFIFTYSRVAWMIFPIFAVVYLIILPAVVRLKVLFYYIAAGLTSLLLLQPFNNYITNVEDKSSMAVITMLVGTAIFIGIYTVLQFANERLQKRHYKIIYITLAGAAVVMGILVTAALNITTPVTFDNTEVLEDRNNTIHRAIRNIEANQDYVLQVNVDSISNEEGQWPWRIRIVGVDGEGQHQTLLTRNGEVEEEGAILIPFTTEENTEGLSIYFDNRHPGTKVTFNEARLMVNGEVVSNIKLSYRFIPESVVNRFNVMNLTERSFTTRTAFYRDSFTIFKGYPIFGAGGGAWNGLYPKYQSEPYFSTEVHNYFLQTLVELGAIGLLLMAALILAILTLFIIYIKKRQLREMTILFAILSLLVHSILDFNFSYLSIPLFMWSLIGVVDSKPLLEDSRVKIINLQAKLNKSIAAFIPLMIILPLLLISFSLYSGHQAATAAVYALQVGGDFDKGYQLMDSAVGRDPFNKEFRMDLAQLQTSIGQQTQQQQWLMMAEENIQSALKYAPYHNGVLQQASAYYTSMGDFEKAAYYLEKLIVAAPLRQQTYETTAKIYKAMGDYYEDLGKQEESFEMYEKVLAVVEEVMAANAVARRPLILNQETIDVIFTKRYILDNINKKDNLHKVESVVYLSYLDLDVDGDGKLDERGWWIWNREGGNIAIEMTEEGTVVTNDGNDIGILLSPQIELQPSKTYGIDLKLKAAAEDHYIQLVIYSGSGTNTQFSQHPLEELTAEGTYSFTFTTTDDIEEGGQNIRLYHHGNTDKGFTVEQILLYEMN